MYGQISFDASKASKGSVAPKGVTAVLIGLMICYQVANQIFLHRAVSYEDADLDSDAACTAYSCMEAKLFQGWHELPTDSPSELEGLLKEDPAVESSPATSSTAIPEMKASGTHALRGDTKPEGSKDILPERALEGMLWDLAWKMGDGDQSHSAPEKNNKPVTSKPNAFMAKVRKPLAKKTSFAKGLTDLQQKLEAKMQAQARRHAEHRALRELHAAARGQSHDEAQPEATNVSMTPWAHDLSELTHDLQDQMQAYLKEHSKCAAAKKTARGAQPCLKESPGAKKTAPEPDNVAAKQTGIISYDVTTPEAQAWLQERADSAAAKKAAAYDATTPWAHDLEDLTHEIEDHMEARKKERAEHAAAHAAAHSARLAAAHAASDKAGHTDTSTSFMDEIGALGRELCQDPDRRNLPSCAQFLHPHASDAEEERPRRDSHASAMAHIKLLEKHLQDLEKDREAANEKIEHESIELMKELCADPARHSYPACARVMATTTSAPATPKANLRSSLTPVTDSAHASQAAHKAVSHPHTLHWEPTNDTEANHAPYHVDSAPLSMSRQELRASHWEGKIPSVACVTVLREGQATETLMRYFMDNYNLQHYEGARELVFVYANTDKETSRIAHLYADGTSIKAVAARAGDGFPSATAYRYGAWLARDRDLVVRWDFEAWHHPNRLSMQVRALTLSKRPASLVTRVTAFDNNGKKETVLGGAGPHGSMMGEAAWMRKHWMPLLEEETTVLHGLHSSDVVQVAMPELLAYHDVAMLTGASPSLADVNA